MTQEFEALAHTMAANAGRGGLRIFSLPYPLESLETSEVRAIADAHFDGLLKAIEAQV